MPNNFAEIFFWFSLALLIWQLVRYVRMDSDVEWYRKHPRDPGPDEYNLNTPIDPGQVPPPPPINKSDVK